ncbi:hypothetical protein [Actinomadura chokoriensis]
MASAISTHPEPSGDLVARRFLHDKPEEGESTLVDALVDVRGHCVSTWK